MCDWRFWTKSSLFQHPTQDPIRSTGLCNINLFKSNATSSQRSNSSRKGVEGSTAKTPWVNGGTRVLKQHVKCLLSRLALPEFLATWIALTDRTGTEQVLPQIAQTDFQKVLLHLGFSPLKIFSLACLIALTVVERRHLSLAYDKIPYYLWQNYNNNSFSLSTARYFLTTKVEW